MKSGSDSEVTFIYCFTSLTLTASGNKRRLASPLVTIYCTFFFNFKIIENLDIKLTYVPYKVLTLFRESILTCGDFLIGIWLRIM